MSEDKKPSTEGLTHIVVWNKHQKMSAKLYGDANFGEGKYDITVRPNDAAKFVDQLKARQEKALVYNFSGQGGRG